MQIVLIDPLLTIDGVTLDHGFQDVDPLTYILFCFSVYIGTADVNCFAFQYTLAQQMLTVLLVPFISGRVMSTVHLALIAAAPRSLGELCPMSSRIFLRSSSLRGSSIRCRSHPLLMVARLPVAYRGILRIHPSSRYPERDRRIPVWRS